ncbi:hypothetical protein PQE74_gp125 [Bacillus phage vB_BanS_Chewbecca]|uniref:Uncharacterized protein n=5 Tax=Caudoviricetes TaxID=2731619 RepID=A0A3Q9R7I2_9CAUD|nr:hypothetical protein PQE69_gp022 [Bacillus phage pW2]YP_010680775.1 hypothetical protein PQE72_gp150 [Bacillus phage vB_BanS_Skywalker]YP_010681028.1 hypothetical protein PQE73_gp132 [Bacillus phage vB_BanS_MrDarsey]YP_010681268.1 hypothetical protein PQE74_gp125 [Bacillus phage vB_BanS_Chewbecca]AZU98875.1 hypothetical protein pW2_37 [Bacillus phage pW2]UGO46208.1 hypothetical protein CHEWBECCA_125 [Bacillus phage vB_BanS_Chewbecca]UGO47964.1 hypothetical protein MRDARSEY_132 [Bacillus ph
MDEIILATGLISFFVGLILGISVGEKLSE